MTVSLFGNEKVLVVKHCCVVGEGVDRRRRRDRSVEKRDRSFFIVDSKRKRK